MRYEGDVGPEFVYNWLLKNGFSQYDSGGDDAGDTYRLNLKKNGHEIDVVISYFPLVCFFRHYFNDLELDYFEVEAQDSNSRVDLGKFIAVLKDVLAKLRN